jgi:saccharopepsin
VDLTKGTEKNVATIPTVVDNLFSAGTIAAKVVGAFFKPSTELAFLDAGELSFGGPDRLKTFGPITYVPITSQSPANLFWGIDQSVKYGTTTILSTTAGIVDTGKFFTYLSAIIRDKLTKTCM